jgi:hypothetical protein
MKANQEHESSAICQGHSDYNVAYAHEEASIWSTMLIPSWLSYTLHTQQVAIQCQLLIETSFVGDLIGARPRSRESCSNSTRIHTNWHTVLEQEGHNM